MKSNNLSQIKIKSNIAILLVLILIVQCIILVKVSMKQMLAEKMINENANLKYEIQYIKDVNYDLKRSNNSLLTFINDQGIFPSYQESNGKSSLAIKKVKFPNGSLSLFPRYEVDILLTPDIDSPVVKNISEGTIVDIIEMWEITQYGETKKWYKLNVLNTGIGGDIVGWIMADSLTNNTDMHRSIIVKENVETYFVQNGELSLSEIVVSPYPLYGYIVKKEDEYVLIVTHNNELYWVLEENVKKRE